MIALGRGLLAAAGLLTVVPTTRRVERAHDLKYAVALFPLVGLLLGVVLYALLSLPISPVPRAALVLAVWVALTGGLHEDGWADTLDAAFAPVNRSARLEILNDPRIGAFGLTGTVVLLLLRFAALTEVAAVAAPVAAVVGRWTMAASLSVRRGLPGSRLGARYAEHSRPVFATVVAAACVLSVGIWSGSLRAGLLAWLVGAGAAAAWGILLYRRLGGLSGDAYGALGLMAELGALYAFVGLAR